MSSCKDCKKKYRTSSSAKLKRKSARAKQWANNLEYRLKTNLRRRINRALSGQKKSNATMKMTGCNITELKAHLESQFTNGMSWDNYGKWHVDHIIPCAMFDLSNHNEQSKCFHYTNLQPLWAEDNARKGSRYVG